jgi:N-methylhydantoinase B
MPIPVAGSEKFAHKPEDVGDLRARVSPYLTLHDLDQEQVDQVDVLTYEVVRHRLWAITNEMGDVLQRMSGSVVVTDCNDFSVSMTDELGSVVQIGLYSTQLAASMDMAIQWTLDQRAANPGIAPGDMWLTNDPWVGGGMHQNDVSLYAPFFWEGELFGWHAVTAHQIDLGGVAPGSWTPHATDVFWESVPIPPIKIVERGELRSDIEDSYLRRSRIPQLVALDLRAKMGALHVAQERLEALITKYGPTTVKAVMRQMMDDVEGRFKAKLRDLPDGTWGAVAHQDQARIGDRGVYKIVLNMHKKDDHLTFDFTGTDPEVEGLINCTYGGARGAVVSMLLTLMCADMPWAPGGLLRCFDIVMEEGTINNCSFPAAIGKASVASALATTNAVNECIAGLLDTHPEYRRNVMSVCCGTWDLTMLAGVDQRANPFVTMLCDAMAGGQGARSHVDGVDAGGFSIVPMGRIADVEMNEFAYPILYLWRREEVDSGGPGRFRGGLGCSMCFVPHGSPIDQVALIVSAAGKALPQASGISGGYPGNTSIGVVVRGSDADEALAAGRIPQRLEDIAGEHEDLPPEYEGGIAAGDVYFTHWQAGGGYGDPLLRDPALVLADVRAGKVSTDAALRIYGVVLASDDEVDVERTSEQRERLRDDRRVAGAVR